MPETIITGNKGEKVRSDCQVQLEIASARGINLEINSKVKSLYGKSIEILVMDILNHYDIKNARLIIDDSGALPFVIAARLETAIRKINPTEKEFLLPFEEFNEYPSKKDRFRFSRLYLPGNTPSLMNNAGIHHPDGIILDLEDSVAPVKKEEARILVRNALRTINFYGAERMVRINQVPEGIQDLQYIVPHNVHVILLPKCESHQQVLKVEEEIVRLKQKHRINAEVYIMPIIESALGVEMAYEIAKSSESVIALAIGLEDYTADIGASRSQDAMESFYARSRIVNACKAARIQAIDSVFSDVSDEEGLRATIKTSKSLGFEGMGCIHPRQIRIIHESYAPEQDEIEKAEKIVNAFMIAEEKGLGVVALGSKMIDPPVVKRAQRIIDLALKLNLIEKNWRDRYVR
ncbi:MAG: aldolase/citrate lyase family protein [Bacteroidales bacterium]